MCKSRGSRAVFLPSGLLLWELPSTLGFLLRKRLTSLGLGKATNAFLQGLKGLFCGFDFLAGSANLHMITSAT